MTSMIDIIHDALSAIDSANLNKNNHSQTKKENKHLTYAIKDLEGVESWSANGVAPGANVLMSGGTFIIKPMK